MVSAPTSAGKTFISSYVIDKAKREGGIVVIVLPTKALVNQVTAQVCDAVTCIRPTASYGPQSGRLLSAIAQYMFVSVALNDCLPPPHPGKPGPP